MSSLRRLLDSFREGALSEREKGTYFEELIKTYLCNEPTYRDLYSNVWSYSDWAAMEGLDRRDTGIDLVAKTRGTDEYHAIQCKLYDESYQLKKADIDSFFTASGKKPFSHRIIISTTNHWSEHADEALRDQQPPVSKIDLFALENSQIDWEKYSHNENLVLKQKHQPKPYQILAIENVVSKLREAERGKLIMACGTGKTFVSLKIAERMTGKNGRVLFLVPSLALLSQALSEWTQQSETPLHSFAVCSDSDVGKKRKKVDDAVQVFTHELRYPATTKPDRLALEMGKRHDQQSMTVVFSTYHSIDVISQAQLKHSLPEFDLIICDEAHRTTGATFDDEDESAFIRVNDKTYIHAKKRLYMTATPRIYGETAKASAEKESVALCSMDDEKLYGKELHVINFSEAVQRGILVDYKVIVLAVEESHINRRLQNLLKDENNQLKVDDASKIVGCWKALSKQGLVADGIEEGDPMQRAVAFCQVIEISKAGKTHKVSSKQIASMFQAVVDTYQEAEDIDDEDRLTCLAEHVDGSMNASEKEAKLEWLKGTPPERTCKILSNVRCLSEGVDVPALDAVLFLTPRNSQIDVVQSVGRVMRKPVDPLSRKKRGYVILPVVIPAGVSAHDALNDNNTYKVVWQVLQALRSHDDRFDAMINKLELIGKDPRTMEVIAITDKIPQKQNKSGDSDRTKAKFGPNSIGTTNSPYTPKNQLSLQFEIGEIERAIYAKMVEKVGNRHHWEEWANDIAKIARTHIDRITTILENPENTHEQKVFSAFAEELRDDLNDSIGDAEIIEMLAQHLVTKPVFDALFEGYSFASNNPMSQAMQGVLDALHEHRLNKEADTLQGFYESVRMRAEGIENAAGKQKIVVELYDKFFRNAFPKMTERLGIVYTPVEVVDFIIHSINDVLQSEFGQTLGSKGVHIIDPFTGTGTFVTRLMQSGLITPEQLKYKYSTEIHANEIVLLAYYIAAINIEAVYHSIVGGDYQPFEGICLTDTFQLHEKEDLVDTLLEDNSARRKRQKELDIRVIMGNPPYSAGQDSQNDNNQNVSYPQLDMKIRTTYAARSKSTNKNSLYDSYIRAIRWATDRIGESGVIGFVTNGGFLDANTSDGLRKCLAEEFSSIYVFHLRGNARTSGELRRKEKDNVFGMGSRAPIAISILVKNPESDKHGNIYFHDIGDYLTREEKLERISLLRSINGISESNLWTLVEPDKHGDWLNQRDDTFESFISMGDKKGVYTSILFGCYSNGVKTNSDAWCFNSSRQSVEHNLRRMIEFYNSETKRYLESDKSIPIEKFVGTDPTKISWHSSTLPKAAKGKFGCYFASNLCKSLYRPYFKQWLYYDKMFNQRVALMPRIFPDKDSTNIVICVSGVGARNFSALASDKIPCLDNIEKGQCFPLYLYDEQDSKKTSPQKDFCPLTNQPKKRDAITDEGLNHFRKAYPNEQITKEDIFYYVYGLLHSPDYRERYADNLSKELPRIPCVKSPADFWAFSKAGRKLADLHINYESVTPYPAIIEGKSLQAEDYRVQKMKYARNGSDKDLATIIYNHKITVKGIPLEAYDYVVNGKSAIDWVVERQCVKTDKDSGIVNDANDWACETMENPRYPLDLLLRVITVSLETQKIVASLPKLII